MERLHFSSLWPSSNSSWGSYLEAIPRRGGDSSKETVIGGEDNTCEGHPSEEATDVKSPIAAIFRVLAKLRILKSLQLS